MFPGSRRSQPPTSTPAVFSSARAARARLARSPAGGLRLASVEAVSVPLSSRDSFLSIASDGSLLSIGSVGSVLSIGSIGSACSAFSVGSAASVGSLFSAGSAFSVFSAGAQGVSFGRPAPGGRASRAAMLVAVLALVLIVLGRSREEPSH